VPTRGPKPAMTVEQIADTAVGIADAEGLAAVSMLRLASDLGFTKMSLYRYVPGKAELVALMVDRAIGGPVISSAAGDWRAGLTAWATHLLTAYLRHPWALEVTVGPRLIGTNEVGWVESGLGLLADTGLTGSERLDTLAVLSGHVRGIAQQAQPNPSPEGELQVSLLDVLRERADQYPQLAAVMRSAATEDGQNQAFTFGLDRILDGLEVLMSRR
jgi:AcrR family transcriptional regulator